MYPWNTCGNQQETIEDKAKCEVVENNYKITVTENYININSQQLKYFINHK